MWITIPKLNSAFAGKYVYAVETSAVSFSDAVDEKHSTTIGSIIDKAVRDNLAGYDYDSHNFVMVSGTWVHYVEINKITNSNYYGEAQGLISVNNMIKVFFCYRNYDGLYYVAIPKLMQQ